MPGLIGYVPGERRKSYEKKLRQNATKSESTALDLARMVEYYGDLTQDNGLFHLLFDIAGDIGAAIQEPFYDKEHQIEKSTPQPSTIDSTKRETGITFDSTHSVHDVDPIQRPDYQSGRGRNVYEV